MTTYCDSIMGARIVRGAVVRVRATGQRVRFHGSRKWGKLYWTCDRHGEIWRPTKDAALTDCPPPRLDVVP